MLTLFLPLKAFESATVLVSDIHNFSKICSKCFGIQVVETLNIIFEMFDKIADKNGVYKVETSKDSFVGIAGAPEKVGA